MKLSVFLAAAIFAVAPAGADEGLKDQTKPQVANADGTFLTEAWRREQTEIRMAELAATRADSPAVKRLADQLLTAHSRMTEDLKDLAKQKALNIWGDPDNMRIAELRQLSGDAFDREYLSQTVTRHDRGIADFDNAIRTSSDPDVKAFATKGLGMLKSHLAMIKGLSTPDAVAPSRAVTPQ